VSTERQTGRVRIYLPATLDELEVMEPPGSRAPSPLGARTVHGVTPALRAELPDEDEEGLEFAALLAAADDSLTRVASRPGAPRFRLVLVLDVPDSVVTALDDDELAPSAVRLTVAVERGEIVCAHVDESAASADVEHALTGDVAAFERLAQRDLLWYDASELLTIPR
jgi:hypothetical protein